MSSTLLFKAFVIERLTATAEEIFQVFERTIVKYEEEASSFKREIERLTGLLQEKQQITDLSSQSSDCKEESPFQSSVGIQHEDKRTRPIKEVAPERWADLQQAEEEQLKIVTVSYSTQSSIYEPDNTEQSFSSWDSEDEFEESEDEQDSLPLDSASSPRTLAQSQGVDDGSESDVSDELLQTSFPTFRVVTELDRIKLRNYKCLSCSKRFSYSQHLINHAIRMHSHDGSLLCNVCGMTLDTTESLHFHLQSHKSSKFCYLCGRECSTIIALSDHMTIHTRVKLHRCPDCGIRFNHKSDLKGHMSIHTRDQFCCPDCGKGFSTSGHMWRHKRSHMGDWL